jgi:hypothetical protein
LEATLVFFFFSPLLLSLFWIVKLHGKKRNSTSRGKNKNHNHLVGDLEIIV